MSIIDERIELFNQIIEDKASSQYVNEKLEELEHRYGKDAFLPFSISDNVELWTEKYYENLIALGYAGASSKEFFLYLVEVRDFLKQEKRKKCISFWGVVAVVIGIIIVLL